MEGVNTLPVHTQTHTHTHTHTLQSRLQSSVSYWPSVWLPIRLSVCVCVFVCAFVCVWGCDRSRWRWVYNHGTVVVFIIILWLFLLLTKLEWRAAGRRWERRRTRREKNGARGGKEVQTNGKVKVEKLSMKPGDRWIKDWRRRRRREEEETQGCQWKERRGKCSHKKREIKKEWFFKNKERWQRLHKDERRWKEEQRMETEGGREEE